MINTDRSVIERVNVVKGTLFYQNKTIYYLLNQTEKLINSEIYFEPSKNVTL